MTAVGFGVLSGSLSIRPESAGQVKATLPFLLGAMTLLFNTLLGGSQRSSLTRRLLCSTKTRAPGLSRKGARPASIGIKRRLPIFREVCLATSSRTVINCFCQSTSSHFKTWSSAYCLTSSLHRTPAKPAIARKGISQQPSFNGHSARKRQGREHRFVKGNYLGEPSHTQINVGERLRRKNMANPILVT